MTWLFVCPAPCRELSPMTSKLRGGEGFYIMSSVAVIVVGVVFQCGRSHGQCSRCPVFQKWCSRRTDPLPPALDELDLRADADVGRSDMLPQAPPAPDAAPPEPQAPPVPQAPPASQAPPDQPAGAARPEDLFPRLVIPGGSVPRIDAISVVEGLHHARFTTGRHARSSFGEVFTNHPEYVIWLRSHMRADFAFSMQMYLVYATLRSTL